MSNAPLRSVRFVLSTAMALAVAIPFATPAAAATGTSRRQAHDPVASAAIPSSLPIAFEANAGQADPRVDFVTRGVGGTAFLAGNDTVVAFGADAVRLRLAGASPGARTEGLDPLPWRVNSFVGERSRWRTGIATYARVARRGVYPGIDLVTYGSDGELEYDFVVAPGADPGRIAVAVAGARALSIGANGDLVAHASGGELRQRRPVAYQTVGGSRLPVAAKFVLRDKDTFAFEIGAYDPTAELVVDPVLTYSTFLGGVGEDGMGGVTVDSQGNAFLTGATSSLDFPATPGAYRTDYAGGAHDGFVAKLDANGDALVYCTYIGGSLEDAAARAVVDGSGNVYVAGATSSTDFPTTAGALQTSHRGGEFDGFVLKLNPQGSGLVYSTYLGGNGDDGAGSLAVSAAGEAFLTGGTSSTNFPTTAGAFDTSGGNLLGIPDAFVTRLNATGTAVVYSTYVGGLFNLEAGAGIVIDASLNAYVSGATNGGFPTTAGAFDTSHNGDFDAFLFKINPTGSSLLYSTYIGGSGEDYSFGIALGPSGNPFMTGYTNSSNFPTAAPFQASIAGGFDAFVLQASLDGASLVYSSFFGGSGNEGLTSNGGLDVQIAGGIAVDASGNAYLTGFTDSTDLPTAEAFQTQPGGGFDAWVAKVAAGGSSVAYASYLGGALEERGTAIAVDDGGSAYVAGFTLSPDFPTTPGAFQTVFGGGTETSDGFLTKVGGAGASDSPGVYAPASSTYFLRNSNSPGAADVFFGYGPGGVGWLPLVGDWDGDGDDTAGLYDPSTGFFYLRNTNSPGLADVVFGYGPGGAGWVPAVGDWDGDGDDTVGLYEPTGGLFFLRNANASGPADLLFGYGPGGAGWVPVIGDWDGDGIDTIGLYDPTTGGFFLRNANAPGVADVVAFFGPAGAGWAPLAGDWDGDGDDTIALYEPLSGTFFLRHTNAPGPADLFFSYGPPGVTPLVGDWDGL